MDLLKVYYKTAEGDFMDILGINEIDPNSQFIPNVYRVEYGPQVYLGTEAHSFLVQKENNEIKQKN